MNQPTKTVESGAPKGVFRRFMQGMDRSLTGAVDLGLLFLQMREGRELGFECYSDEW